MTGDELKKLEPMERAQALIREEMELKTGTLDLGSIGITELPVELWGKGWTRQHNLKHVTHLSLGSSDDRSIAPNNFTTKQFPLFDRKWRKLSSLVSLSLERSFPEAAQDFGIMMFGASEPRNQHRFSAVPSLPGKLKHLVLTADFAPEDIDMLEFLTKLEYLRISSHEVIGLRPLAKLKSLRVLDLAICPSIANLAPLSKLKSLQALKLKSCGRVSDLTPLAKLKSLQALDLEKCEGIVDLSPLTKRRALQNLNLTNCKSLTDFRPLAALTQLQILNLKGNQSFEDTEILRSLRHLSQLDLQKTSVTNLTGLSSLAKLQDLNLADSQVVNLAPLSGLLHLQSLNLSNCKVQDLSPLTQLPNLRVLDLQNCDHIQDFSPLEKIPGLEIKNLSNQKGASPPSLPKGSAVKSLELEECTQSEIDALAEMTELETLLIDECEDIEDFSALANLTNLKTLELGSCGIRDLEPLGALTQLEELHISSCENASDATPLARLPSLKKLNIHFCKIQCVTLTESPMLEELDLSDSGTLEKVELAGLSNLHDLDLKCCEQLASVRIVDCPELKTIALNDKPKLEKLEISGLPTLEAFELETPQNFDLRPLANCSLLRELKLVGTSEPPDVSWLLTPPSPEEPPLILRDSFKWLQIAKTSDPEIPNSLLSRMDQYDVYDNCLDRLRSYLKDRGEAESTSVAYRDLRFVVLGNSGVGKTQICNRLQGLAFDENGKPTNGMVISDFHLDESKGLDVRDFGADALRNRLYAPFIKNHTVIILVWEDSETATGEDGFHQPLTHWLQELALLGEDIFCPIIVCQNKVEDPANANPDLIPSELKNTFKPDQVTVVQCSARENHLDALNEAIDAQWTKLGMHKMGSATAYAIKEFKALRKSDSELPAEERKFRLLGSSEFAEVIQKAQSNGNGTLSDNGAGLALSLVESGFFEGRHNVWNRSFILDSTLLTDAMAAIVNRASPHAESIRTEDGIVSDEAIKTKIWKHFSDHEREFLIEKLSRECLSMFELQKPKGGSSEERFAIIDFLPEWEDSVAAKTGQWDQNYPEMQEVQFRFPIMSRMVFWGILRYSMVPAIFKDTAVGFWKTGALYSSRDTDAKGLIREVRNGDGGAIVIQAQGEGADQLLPRLQGAVAWGLNFSHVTGFEIVDSQGNALKK
tara:strand:+ start:2661 stop:6140 length:3480 start_codon:yes stop_codon:yes gene_type:complete